MRVEELKRGHWIMIAILLGAALAWVQGFWSSSATQTNAQSQLEMLLYRQPVRAADGATYPQVRDITIYPPVEAGFTMVGASGDYVPSKSIVRYSILTAAPDRKGWYYKPAVSLVDHPYRPGGRPAQNPNLTMQEYLDGLSANRDWIKYKYAWWAEPRWSYTIWIGGCLLVLGIAWPTVQSRLVSAGYGRPPEEREKKQSFLKRLFSRKAQSPTYSSDDSVIQRKSTSIELSQDDLDRIARMEAELADFAKSGDREVGGEIDEKAAQQIKQLNAGPLEIQKVEEAPKEEQDYGGEFYPTVAHSRKKPDAKP